MSDQSTVLRLPLKSVAGALLFTIFFGPVGLLYSSVIGGAILSILCLIAAVDNFFVAFGIFWIVSCVWGVAAVNRYNRKLIKIS